MKTPPRSRRIAGLNGPTVTDACEESERVRVRSEASLRKKLAAEQNVSRIKSMGERRANRPACMPHEIAGTTTMFPSQANGESVLK